MTRPARCNIEASPRRVFAVLADPRCYAYWVVGSKRIRAADPEWPAVGSAFHHAVGFGPLRIEDCTRVEALVRRRLIRLRAKARPLGTAFVTVALRRRRGATEVTMTEGPADAFTALLLNPLTQRLIRARNLRSLARLKALAERRVHLPAGEPARRWRFRRRHGRRRAALR